MARAGALNLQARPLPPDSLAGSTSGPNRSLIRECVPAEFLNAQRAPPANIDHNNHGEDIDDASDDEEVDQDRNLDPRLRRGGDNNANPQYIWVESPIVPEEVIVGRRGAIPQSSILKYKGPKPGPRNIPARAKSELDFFLLLMDLDLLETFVVNSNAYAKSKSFESRFNLTLADLLKFIGCILMMGLIKVPQARWYWSTTRLLKDNFVKRCFSKHAFEALFGNLHFVNTALMTQAEKKAAAKEDGFWQVSGLLK